MLFKSRNAGLIGKVLQALPTCSSTNDWLKTHPAADGTVVYTFAQTSGRGQRGHNWVDVPGKNLAFSVLLKELQCPLQEVFWLNKAVAIAVHDVLTATTEVEFALKWPNDILWHDQKVAGILIENQMQANVIHQSIIGIGINADVTVIPEDIPEATSLRKITDRPQLPAALVVPLVEALRYRLAQLDAGAYRLLNDTYHTYLYQMGVERLFSVNGVRRFGCISGVNDEGQLLVKWGKGAPAAYNHGAIHWEG